MSALILIARFGACAALRDSYADGARFRTRVVMARHRFGPPQHETFIERCRQHGQARPTPLLLRYEAGGYNCLHPDLYGAVYFPLQMVVMLSEPVADYDGGHFLLVENRPRAQSAGEALRPRGARYTLGIVYHDAE